MDEASRETEDRVSKLAHDLRHQLYVFRTGLDLLQQLREDRAQFEEILALLRKDEENARGMIEELIRMARG